MRHNEYKKLVLGFQSLPFNNEGIIAAEGRLIGAGFSIEHSMQEGTLTVYFANKRELDTIAGILKF